MHIRVVLLCLFCLSPSIALADPSIIFNGIDVTGVTNQKFTDVTVEFDAKGNVILTAPQYKLVDTTPKAAVAPSVTSPAQVSPSAATIPVPAAAPGGIATLPDGVNPTYLVATFDSPGLLGFNIDVYVNGKFIKTVLQGQAQQTLDISQYLTKGKNTIQYRMTMAADSGTSSKATVELSLAKLTGKQGNAVELTGQSARMLIKGADGAQVYSVDFMVP